MAVKGKERGWEGKHMNLDRKDERGWKGVGGGGERKREGAVYCRSLLGC